jgi:prepilin-type N-terminal cleavage/methylation domain-containing protein
MIENNKFKKALRPPAGGSGQVRRAFTLIEIIVVVAITSVILIITMQILTSAIRIESRTLVAQAMYEQVNYLVDYMSKDIRMASRGTIGGDCGLPALNKFLNEIPESIALKDQRNNCMQYFLAKDSNDNAQLMVGRRDWDANTKTWGALYSLPLTSNDYKVTDFKAIVIPSPNSNTQKDNQLTKVLIGMTIESKTYSDIKLRIQTLVSTRNRD